jgi:hypothetical protein
MRNANVGRLVITAELKRLFREYVEAAQEASSDLEFLLEQLAESVPTDATVASLETLEGLYWKYREEGGYPEDLGTPQDYLELVCRYLGQCIVERCSGRWAQTTEKNRRFGQPCVGGFGNKKWDKVYPVSLAKTLPTLAETNPSFPGVRDRRVLACQLEKALEISEAQPDPH